MKYLIVLLIVVACACKKENATKTLSIDALVVNDEQIKESSTYAVGQVLKIRPYFADGSSNIKVSWSLSPDDNQPTEQNESLFVWRPNSIGNFELTVHAKNNAGGEASTQYSFKTMPADIRYNVWGNSKADVDYNELYNQSEFGEWGGMGEGGYLIKHSDIPNGRNDNAQPGEIIWYIYDGKMDLVGAQLEIPIPGQQDAEGMKAFYDNIRLQRLSEYTYMGHDNTFASPEYISQYQDRPDLWLEAVQKGLMILGDVYENDRTIVKILWYGGPTVSLNYTAKK